MNHVRTKPIEQSPLAQRPLSGIARLNIALAVCSVVMMVYYVVQSNGMAVQIWRTRDAQVQLASLQEDRNGLVARQSALENRDRLVVLATGAGMVPAGSVVYLVQDKPVAAR